MATARMRRLAADYEQVMEEFCNHENITIEPLGEKPPEHYKLTYFVNGIYLLPDGQIEILSRHEVEIILHADYPRYKPICKIATPIWHPNFRDGQICIGDIWGAGESLTDIIVHIGDMLQYKSWNSSSPLCAEAAQWAVHNKHLFPVGTADLYRADPTENRTAFEIDLYDNNDNVIEEIQPLKERGSEPASLSPTSRAVTREPFLERKEQNDFDISAEELKDVVFIPTAQRMQSLQATIPAASGLVNFRTIFTKGILYGLIGGLLGWVFSEMLDGATSTEAILRWYGFDGIHDLMRLPEYEAMRIGLKAIRISSALFSSVISAYIGLVMGIGEGIYYGSTEKAKRYSLIGLGIAVIGGFLSGYIAQAMYSALLAQSTSELGYAFVRGIGWSIMGMGIGFAIGLLKPEKKRILYCALGGLLGGFLGGFVFNFVAGAVITKETDTGILPRAIGITIMGGLIGLGVGLLEQVAKTAWLKVLRGDFVGKEYLIFPGTTSIGNDSSNSIVLFKDKLVAVNHCEIIQQGSKFILVDKGTSLGTFVNGKQVQRHLLNQGDAIAVGNSVLIFNTK